MKLGQLMPGDIVSVALVADVYRFAGPNLWSVQEPTLGYINKDAVCLVVGLHCNCGGIADEALLVPSRGPIGWVYANDLRKKP